MTAQFRSISSEKSFHQLSFFEFGVDHYILARNSFNKLVQIVPILSQRAIEYFFKAVLINFPNIDLEILKKSQHNIEKLDSLLQQQGIKIQIDRKVLMNLNFLEKTRYPNVEDAGYSYMWAPTKEGMLYMIKENKNNLFGSKYLYWSLEDIDDIIDALVRELENLGSTGLREEILHKAEKFPDFFFENKKYIK